MSRNPDRPLSPHLTIWKWGPHMLVSILHRITGSGLAVARRSASSSGGCGRWPPGRTPMALLDCSDGWNGLVVLVGLTWAFLQHLLSGIRHLVMDIGAGFELRINKLFAVMTIVGSLFLTALTWF